MKKTVTKESMSGKYPYFHEVSDERSYVFYQDMVVMLSVVILAHVAVGR